MPKTKTVFFCQSCGYESAKWLGKCPSCNAWNSFGKEVVTKTETYKNEWRTDGQPTKTLTAKTLAEIETGHKQRIPTPEHALNRDWRAD